MNTKLMWPGCCALQFTINFIRLVWTIQRSITNILQISAYFEDQMRNLNWIFQHITINLPSNQLEVFLISIIVHFEIRNHWNSCCFKSKMLYIKWEIDHIPVQYENKATHLIYKHTRTYHRLWWWIEYNEDKNWHFAFKNSIVQFPFIFYLSTDNSIFSYY